MPTIDDLDQELAKIMNDEGRAQGPATAATKETPEENVKAQDTTPDGTSSSDTLTDTAGPEDDLDRRRELEPVEEQDGKRRLVVANPAIVLPHLLEAIGTAELAGLFRRSGELVQTPRIGEEGYIEEEHDTGPAQVRNFTAGQLAALVDLRFACGVWVKDKENPQTPRWIPRLVPRDPVNRAYDATRGELHAPALRELHMVSHTPMMRADGSILDRPGYDDRTRVLFLPDWDLVTMEKVDPQLYVDKDGERIWLADIAGARERLLDLTREFPWVSDDDRATWYGLLFTPLMRAMFPPPYMLGLITAPNPRSGKSLLAWIIEQVHGGVHHNELPRNEDELSKVITATLVDTTAPVVVFDNVRGVIRSSTLEGVLASADHSGRYLGHSRMINAKNDRVWIMTGNNATVAGDLAPRIMPIMIDPKHPHPELRKFRSNLYEQVPKLRGAILHDMLTIIRAWVLDGGPLEMRRTDEYGRWDGAMRGLLHWAGFPGTFGGTPERAADRFRDEEADEWHTFLVAIHTAIGRPVTSKELVQALENGRYHDTSGHKCDDLELDPHHLPGDLADKFSRIQAGRSSGFSKSLGRWLMNRDGRYANGWKVEKVEQTRDGWTWTVIPP
jgi:hypothetical protein